jgi:hypothetical protein
MDATGLAARLDLDVDAIGICHACLSFVSMALDSGDERDVRGQVNYFAPVLWEEGLALAVQAALERARRRGDVDAESAIADVERRGGRSIVVKAIVRVLAAQLSRRARERFAREAPAAPVLQLRRPT